MPVPDFSSGEVLTAAAMDSIGLWLVKTQTVGTGVASVTVTDAFNDNFANYRIVISGGTHSVSGDNINFQFSGITGNVYQTSGYFITYGTPTLSAFAPAATSSWLVGFFGQNNTSNFFDITNPKIAKQKGFTGLSSAFYNYSFSGQCTSTSTATGFVLTPNTGTITGQTIRVYGYRN